MPWDQLPTIIISSVLIFRNFSNVLHMTSLLHCQIILSPQKTTGNQNNNNKASIPPQSQAKTSNQKPP